MYISPPLHIHTPIDVRVKHICHQIQQAPSIIQSIRTITHDPPHDLSPNSTNILLMDSGGGRIPTITKRAWYITSTHSHQSSISGYQSTSPPRLCPIVNAITKVQIPGRDLPVLFIMNYATLVDDPNESESLCVPFAMMAHGISIDITPTIYGGTGGIKIVDQFFPFNFDGEKLFYSISMPTEEDIHTLEAFQLTSPLPEPHVHRLGKRIIAGSIPIAA